MSEGSVPVPDEREDRLLPWSRVHDITGLSRTTAWRMQRSGDFPAPVPVSPGRVGWSETELTAWKAARKAGGRVRPDPFTRPRTPKLIETARSPKPAKATEISAPPDAIPAVQASLPLRPAAAPARPAKHRARPISPDQIDFGF
jgi:prophage regulatory protein